MYSISDWYIYGNYAFSVGTVCLMPCWLILWYIVNWSVEVTHPVLFLKKSEKSEEEDKENTEPTSDSLSKQFGINHPHKK